MNTKNKSSIILSSIAAVLFGILFFTVQASAQVTGEQGTDLQITKTVRIVYPATSTPENLAPIGALEQVDGSAVASGWAVDPNTPTSSIEVDLYLDAPIGQGQIIGAVIADQPRPDVTAHTQYAGNHGFIFPLAIRLGDGVSHKLYAYARDSQNGTPAELSGSGLSFGSSVSPIKTASTTPADVFSFTSIFSKLFSSPKAVQTVAVVNTAVVAPVGILTTTPVGFLIELFSLPGLWELSLFLKRLWYGLLTLLGLRKRRRPWGTVYDSKTKQPLDPVLVTLYNAVTSQKVEEAITDLAGRYGFLVQTGSFFIRAQKSHYVFPSAVVVGMDDGIFKNVYHGENIVINATSDIVTPNIPMDAYAVDWNQQEKTRQNLGALSAYPRLESFFTGFFGLLFWLAVITTLATFVGQPTVLTGCMLALCVCMVLYKLAMTRQRLWGTLSNGGPSPLAGYTLQVSHVEIPDVRLARAITAPDGKFFLRTIPGTYLLSVFNPEKILVQRVQMEGNEEGVLNRDVHLE